MTAKASLSTTKGAAGHSTYFLDLKKSIGNIYGRMGAVNEQSKNVTIKRILCLLFQKLILIGCCCCCFIESDVKLLPSTKDTFFLLFLFLLLCEL